MTVTYENNIKKINGRTLEVVLKDLKPGNRYYEPLKVLFKKVNTKQELITELKELYKEHTPVFILTLMMWLCGYNMAKGNDLLEEVMSS